MLIWATPFEHRTLRAFLSCPSCIFRSAACTELSVESLCAGVLDLKWGPNTTPGAHTKEKMALNRLIGVGLDIAWSRMEESLMSSAVQHARMLGFQDEGEETGIFFELRIMSFNRGRISLKVGTWSNWGIWICGGGGVAM
jgi:hypothetical protein